MKRILFLFLAFAPAVSFSQIKIDTTAPVLITNPGIEIDCIDDNEQLEIDSTFGIITAPGLITIPGLEVDFINIRSDKTNSPSSKIDHSKHGTHAKQGSNQN